MKSYAKVTTIVGGYVAAILIAAAAVAIRVATMSGPDAQASSGMYAFGDALLFVGVFGVCALAPTGIALFFLRPYERWWRLLSVAGIAVAVTGVAAAIIFAVSRNATAAPLATWAAFSVLRILVAPLLAITFLLCTLLAPFRFARYALGGAALLEAAVSTYAGVVWFLPLVQDRP